MQHKILNTVGPKFADLGKDVLSRLGVVDYCIMTQTQLEEAVEDYDVLFVQLGLNVNKRVIDRGRKLKVIATATTGLDHIDVAYAQKKGILIVSLRGEDEFLRTIPGTAELAFGLVIALYRKIPFAFESVKRNEWNREGYRGYNLRGKTLGILGLGRLGKMMATYGAAFGMRVIAHDPHVADARATFDELLHESDVLSVHVHLSSETENLLNRASFPKMKRGALLINTARGKIVNEKDVIESLESGALGGYGADVLSDELAFGPTFPSTPLVEYAKTHENVIIVPHIGGMTHESREATDIFIAEKLEKVLRQYV